MKFRFLTNGIMGNKSGVLKTVLTGAAAVVIGSSPVGADTNNQVEPQKIEHKLNKKTQNVTCATKLACEALSNSIQNQIDELEAKGLENLTESEFNKYDKLSDKLIALENNKQAEENQKQETIRKSQDIKLAELRGVLLSD